MVKMTQNSAMGGLLELIKDSAIWKSVLREAVLREASVYFERMLFLNDKFHSDHEDSLMLLSKWCSFYLYLFQTQVHFKPVKILTNQIFLFCLEKSWV